MHKIIVGTLAVSGLIIGASTIAAASPATPLLSRERASQTAQVQPVYYNWHHHRYYHRSWDRRHRRWRYY